MFRTLSGFVALAALTACGAEWTVVDMDGDGVPFSEDCDESNADIGPGMDEIWYDGIDQNCDGNDADKDGDGFISVDVPAGYDWTAFEAHVAEGDCWDDPDSIPADYEIVEGEGFTQPTAAEVNPDAEDSWYDGPDQDCGGNSDFDQDGDGYDSNGWTRQDGTLGDDCADGTDRDDALQLACGDDTTLEELLELYGWTTADVNAGQATDEWYDGLDANCDGESDYDSDADGFDTCDECDDTDPDKKPTGAEEIWYDCADDDCDGNDGDQDGDGYVSVEYTEACPNWEEFSAHFNGLGADGYGDCVDDPADIPTEYTPLPGYSSIDAQDIHPTAYDMVYDGIDADCAGDTDFDGDGDGYESDDDQQRDGSYGSDCDDDEGTTYPGAQEYCETPAVDSDCDGDDNDINSIGGSTYYYDGDEDTYGELDNTGATYCEPNETTKYTSESNDDCDDGDNTIYPGATEIIADGVDDDCDNSDLCYVDDDGDGWGDDDGSTVVGDGDLNCNEPNAGEANDMQDCLDSNDDAYPGSAKLDSSSACMEDADGDGYGDDDPPTDVTAGTDCDDASNQDYPGASESVANGDDEDCDGYDDCYQDNDGDGYGSTTVVTGDSLDCDDAAGGFANDDDDCKDSNANAFPGASPNESGSKASACTEDADGDDWGDSNAPSGVTDGTDCDDGDNTIYPGATEIIADGVDDDCDNSDLCYVDDDGDGWGDDDGSTVVGDGDLNCNEPSAGEANDMQDCLDSNGDAYPGAAENESGTDCMEDADGDGWGDDTPPGGVTAGLDCDDGESTSYPGATEITADEIDSDCDGGEICYEDSDYDGYGSTSTTSSTTDADCQDTGESLVDTDCLDTNADAFPGSAENESSTICMEDADGDGYGDDAAPGGVTDGNDCDDGDSAVNPAASEITADGIDNDCDSSYNCYRDLDLDGYGTTTTRASTDSDCTDSYESNVSTDCYDNSSLGSETYPGAAPNDSGTSCMRDDDEDDYGDTTAPGTAVAGTDCDDDDADINAGESETTADGVDQDCDGYETCYDDADEDGYRTTTTTSTTDTDCSDADHALSSDDDGDCDDADEFTHPGAAENESSTACRTDADEDGYGSDSAPSGGTAGSDCDDGDDGINVAADETVADGTDQDCDGYDDCYEDLDQDGYGSTTEITGTDLTCANTGESDDDDDCDDSDEFTYPGAAESESASECQTDADEDGYGSTTAPSGGDAGTDCDDGDDAINPGETEADDDVDQDCDDIVDEGFYSAGDLIFSELMANPYADEPDGEWFEVYNASGADIYLDGWYFKLGSNTQAFYVGPGDAFIADGDYLVFCSDDTQTLNHADTVAGGCDYVYGSDVNSASEQGDTYDTNAGLANVGEQLDIMIGGTTIDTVDTSDASFTAPSEGSSIALDIDWLTDTDNDDGANWCESTELFFDTTPGASADEYGTPQTGAVCDVDPA